MLYQKMYFWRNLLFIVIYSRDMHEIPIWYSHLVHNEKFIKEKLLWNFKNAQKVNSHKH